MDARSVVEAGPGEWWDAALWITPTALDRRQRHRKPHKSLAHGLKFCRDRQWRIIIDGQANRILGIDEVAAIVGRTRAAIEAYMSACYSLPARQAPTLLEQIRSKRPKSSGRPRKVRSGAFTGLIQIRSDDVGAWLERVRSQPRRNTDQLTERAMKGEGWWHGGN